MSSGKGKCKRANGSTENGVKNPSKKSKTFQSFKIRQEIANSETVLEMKNYWNSKKHLEDQNFLGEDITLFKTPFKCCRVNDFIGEKGLVDKGLQNLLTDLDSLDLNQKNNDLYKFQQSNDLYGCEIPSISNLKCFLLDHVKPWLQSVTGIDDLTDQVDIFCAKYGHTDHLLCHDDKLEGRRIAYILYLVPEDWTAADGGALDLFSSEDGQPGKVVKSVIPAFNSFAFFEVSPVSYHQVAEVLSDTKVRLSVTGWFHSPPTQPKLSTTWIEPLDITEDDFYGWINPIYLDPITQSEISEKFEESCELSIKDFLVAEKYHEVCEAFLKIDKEWTRVGPPNIRSYECLPLSDSDSDTSAAHLLIKKCVNFLQSDALALALSNMTGLKFHPLASDQDEDESEDEKKTKGREKKNGKNDEPSSSTSTSKEVRNTGDGQTDDEDESEGEIPTALVRAEVRRWKSGSYSLMHDQVNLDLTKPSLDLKLFFNCPDDWNQDWGGFTSYAAKGEEDEILNALPEPNTLQLVYKEPEIMGFVKYLNSSGPTEFHDISLTYLEISN